VHIKNKKQLQMKKVFSILAVAGLMTACNNAEKTEVAVGSTVVTGDSAAKAVVDSAVVTVDSAAKDAKAPM
jgi:hypothetical protein